MFENPTKLELNTDAIDAPNWISADGCVINFTRQVTPTGGAPNYDLYTASKPL